MIPQPVRKTTIVLLVSIVSILPIAAEAQQPYPGQMPAPHGPPPAPGQPQAPSRQQMPGQQQMPAEYAFRPDLTNPEYGRCLNLEKHWKNMWQMYAHQYQVFRSMGPRDPRAVRLSYFLRDLRGKLDAAWENFSRACVYFPRQQQPPSR